MQVPSPNPLLEFLSTHIQLIGWPALCVIAWRASGIFSEFVSTFKAIDARTKTTETTISVMKSNHLAHIEAAGGETTKALQRVVDVLTQMDTSLKILLDRGNTKS